MSARHLPFALDPPNSLYLQPHLAEELLKLFLLNLIALDATAEASVSKQLLPTTAADLTERPTLKQALVLFQILHTVTQKMLIVDVTD